MDDKSTLRMAVISGASHALKYKRAIKMSTDEEILKKISEEVDEILDKIGLDE